MIVVDNGSRDATADVARGHGARVVGEPRPGYGAAVQAGLEAATVGVRRGDGRRRLLRPRRAAGRCSPRSARGRADLAAGPPPPGRPGVWPWHARVGNALVVAVAAPAGPASRCTTSRRCGSAAAPTCSRSTYATGASATRSSCCARRRGAGWRIAEYDVTYRPRAAGTRVQGQRLACAGPSAPPATSGRCCGRHEGAGGRQGARRRTGEDPARHGDRHGRGGPGGRRRAARHPRRLPSGLRRVPPRARRRPAPAPARRTRCATQPGRLGRAPAARRRTSASAWPTRTPTRRGPGPTVQVGMDTPQLTAADLREVAAAAATGDAVLGPAADGGWWVLALSDPAAAARPGRRTDVAAGHLRRAPATRSTRPGRPSGSGPGAAPTSTPSRDADAVADCARPAATSVARLAGGVPMTVMTHAPARQRLHAGAAGAPVHGVGRRPARAAAADARPGSRAPAPADRAAARPLPRTDGRHRLRPGPDDRGPGPTRPRRCSASTSCPRRSGRPAAAASRALRAASSTRCPGEGRWETALLADGNIGIGGDPVALLAARPRAARRRTAASSSTSRRGAPVSSPGTSRLETARGRERTRSRGPLVGADAIQAVAAAARLGLAIAAPVRRPLLGRARGAAVKTADAARAIPREADFTSWLRSPAVTARVGLLARHLLRPRLRHRADQPLGADPVAVAAVPDQPELGLPGHPGRPRRSRARRPCRCCSSSSGPSSPSCSRGPPRERPRAGPARARAGLDRRAGRGRDLPARHRAGQRRAVVPLALQLPPHPLRRSPGSRSAPWSCTSRSSCPIIRHALGDRRRQHGPGPAARQPAPASCRGAACCAPPGPPPGSRCSRRPARTVPWLRRVSVLGVRSGDGPQGVPINHSRGVPRRGRGRHQRGVPADGGARRPGGAAQPGRPARDAADDGVAPDRLRRGLERRRDLDRRTRARPARPRRRARRAARCSSSRCRSTAASGSARCAGNFSDHPHTLLALEPGRRAAVASTTASPAGSSRRTGPACCRPSGSAGSR